jgi:hypothetical protein
MLINNERMINMEEKKYTSISVNLNDGSIIISGSEEFVERNKKDVFEFVERNFNTSQKNRKKINTPMETSESSKEPEQVCEEIQAFEEQNTDKYVQAGVYHIDSEGSIAILKKVPGNNMAEKTKNIALIVLHIHKGKVLGKDIIPLCEKHGCYDKKNFASIFKREKTNIVKKGSGKNWTLELTRPGEMAAIELLEEMANGKK